MSDWLPRAVQVLPDARTSGGIALRFRERSRHRYRTE